MPTEIKPLSPDLTEAMAKLAETLDERGDHGDIAARYEWLLDMLILRGQLPPSVRRLSKKVNAERSTVRLATFRDKYNVESSDLDCAALMPICQARCCTYEVSLSPQDVAEGLPYDMLEPYKLPKKADGTCGCGGPNGSCGIYEKRPGACRAYDCRMDERVWEDFEARKLAPRE